MNFTMTNSEIGYHITMDYDTNFFGMSTGFMGCTLTVMGKIEGEWKCTTI